MINMHRYNIHVAHVALDFNTVRKQALYVHRGEVEQFQSLFLLTTMALINLDLVGGGGGGNRCL